MPLTDTQSLEVHIQAVLYEAQVQVCAKQFSGMAAPLQEAYAQWRSTHAVVLQQGSAVAEQRGMSGPQQPSLAQVASMRVQLLDALPRDDMQRRCGELLASVSVLERDGDR